ncbi:MAG: IS66 family transposase [Nocardioidaceae bacterium]
MAGYEGLSRTELLRLLGERDAEIAELKTVNAELAGRVGRLERLVSRNSGNSSMPPSGDDAPGRAKPASKQQDKKRSGRRRGKQPGAGGQTMEWVSDPDEQKPHRPEGSCGCGADLAGAADVGVERSHQVHDLPQVAIKVTQHDVWRVRCACGKEHVGTLPDQVSSAPASYGLNLKSLAVYLLIYQHVPTERCTALIADWTGSRAPSTGFIHSMLARTAACLTGVIKLIKTAITAAAVAGFDETTIRAGDAGCKDYVLSASTETATVYHLGGRDLGSFTDFGILPGFAGIAVHDRYAAYFCDWWKHLAGHQVCAAHLLRDFQDAAEHYPDAIWPVQAQRALRGLIRAWHTARNAGQSAIPAKTSDPLITEFAQAVLVGLSAVPRIPGPRHRTAQRPGRELLEFCSDRQADVLRFCTDTRVWPTNNISERHLRPTKTQQKISGRFTSEEITQDRLDIRSYIDTARKNGINVLAALRDALAGNPWQPPSAAPT